MVYARSTNCEGVVNLSYLSNLLVLSIAECQRNNWVQYGDDGSIVLSHPEITRLFGKDKVKFDPSQQHDAIFASFTDLSKSLSTFANSPVIEGSKSLREQFNEEFATYQRLLTATEPNQDPAYGSYVVDHVAHRLCMVMPEYWHRLGLVTNNGNLISDPENKMMWQEVREKLEKLVVGVAGVSVGGNILEGVCRELRPKAIKIADLDWIELTNLNRLNRGNSQSLTLPAAKRQNARNPYEMNRLSKAELTAYQHQLVDPYAAWYVYKEGLDDTNIHQFLDGKDDEPALDIVIEEVDDMALKVKLREECRKRRVPVIMLSDFGHRVLVQIHDYRNKPNSLLGCDVPDTELNEKLHRAIDTGNRVAIFEFIAALCGEDYARDEIRRFIAGEGEQPTSSMPQSGATALVAGGVGAKVVWQYFLGYELPDRFAIDLRHYRVDK